MAPAADSNPGHAGLQHCFGIPLWRLKRFEEAEAALRRAIAARPGWAHAIHFLALAVVMQGRETEAEPLFRISAEMTREPWAEAHFWIGYCLDASGYVDAAASEMRRALAIKPSLPDPAAWLRRKGLVL